MRSHHSQAREGWQASLKGHQGHKATATVFNAIWGKSTTDLQSAVVSMAVKAFCHAWASALGSCRVMSWHVYIYIRTCMLGVRVELNHCYVYAPGQLGTAVYQVYTLPLFMRSH